VYRVREGLPLAGYDRKVFYTPKEPKGYIDYPLSQQYLQKAAVA
jgi:NADPH2 dehydrogenase